jgi:hypothetical protein
MAHVESGEIDVTTLGKSGLENSAVFHRHRPYEMTILRHRRWCGFANAGEQRPDNSAQEEPVTEHSNEIGRLVAQPF